MFVVLESKKVKTLRRDLSMSKDMRDWPRANLGVAAMYVFWGAMKWGFELQTCLGSITIW